MYYPAPKTRITASILLLCLAALAADAVPHAAFTADQTIGCPPLTVRFTNQSTGATSWYWDLGNGNTSTLANPVNIYTVPGTYTVTLVATDAAGSSDTIVRNQYITVSPDPVADFSAALTTSCLDGNLISFSNNSTPGISYLWDFGDGTISTLPNPLHTYAQAGLFSVNLVATNAQGCAQTRTRSGYIRIYPPPVADIHSSDTVVCDSTSLFSFSNAVTGGFMQWDFGDGTQSSAIAPSHQYAAAGSFGVSLTVTDGNGCTASDTLSVRVMPGNLADFISDFHTGCIPMSIKFTADVPNAAYDWDFGDGGNSAYGAVYHTYTTPGSYGVRLIVTMPNGCSDTLFRPAFIAIGTEPSVDFSLASSSGCSPFQASFTNLSSNYTSCSWNFGDGGTSSLSQPAYTYATAGTYPVTLTCTNAFGCTSHVTKNDVVQVTAVQAAISSTVRNGCPPLTVPFENHSQGNGMTFLWNFGDGQTSALPSPVHTYNTLGPFQVTLIARDSTGCTDTIVKPAYIQVSDPSMGYIPPPTITGCAPYTASFTDATSGATSWLWNFGDGTTSTLQNPQHTFTTAGQFTVSLSTQSSGGGCAGNIPVFSTFDIQGGFAAFTDTFDQCPPYDVQFFDSSSGAVSWFWQFGDGTTSTLQNPVHTYGMPGYHSVSLVINTASGCTFSTMKSNGIYFAPFAASFYSVPMSSTFPMTINFYANSIGANAWLWDFGDSTSSTLENPVHTYTDSGDYNVTLTISNGLCSLFYDPPPLVFSPPDSSHMQPPPAGQPPVPQYGCAPFNVSFAYQVQGALDWLWRFGDGDSSSSQYPIHTYSTPGAYSVDLITTDSFGTQSPYRFDTIVHVNGPAIAFTYTQSPSCQFTQVSVTNQTNGAQQYFWDFGDGSTDTLVSPVHVYTSGQSNYILTLRATDSFGCQDILSTSMFAGNGSPMLISESDVCGTDTVRFSSGLQNYTSYAWDFGDGTTDTARSPWHIYTQPGVFLPSLTVTDAQGCSITQQAPYPVTVSMPLAGFSAPDLHGCDKLDATFVNTSTGADAFSWNFGDGTTSSNYQPVHSYNQAGTYSVTLTAYKNGCSDSIVRSNYIRVDTAHAECTYSLGSVCLPYSVSFTDLSVNAVAWDWYFGDYRHSSLQNPVHEYDSIQPNTGVILTIVDVNGCTDEYRPPMFYGPYMKISADQTSGCLPLQVSFSGSIALSSGYSWDFGDGSTSTALNPTHTYSAPGIYRVKFIASSLPQYGLCSDTLYLEDTIRVIEPHAGFNTPDIAACAPSLVQFNNSSTESDSYLWSFGDGSVSNSVSPSHLYKNPGLYTVSLVAISSLGCSDTLVRNQYVRVLGPVTKFSLSDTTGCLPLVVGCTDSSSAAVTWMWSFGDGYSSTDPSPVHAYTDSGVYSVTLITTDTVGCTSFLEYPFKVHANPNPVAAFAVSDSTGCGNLAASFTNLSSGFSGTWWDLGDGSYSVAANPSHAYPQAGTFAVTLVAFNRYGCTDTLHHPAAIRIYPQPVAAFTPSATEGCPPLNIFFSNQSIADTGASYSWSFGNGSNSVQPVPTGNFPYPGIYSVSLTVTDPSGCSDSISMPSLVHVFDTLPPPATHILSVSVSSDSTVDITWENSAALDLGEYRLFRLNNVTGSYELVYKDTNPANTNFALTSTYTDRGLNTLRNVYTYKLQTLDYCRYTLPLDSLQAHNTINVEAAVTGLNIRVTWNAYGGCPVSSYELYRVVAPGAFQYLATLPADSLAYTDSSFICPELYVYRIRATDLCGNTYDSWSDTSAARPNHVFGDQRAEMVRSTVVDNSYVLTEWLPPVVRPLSVVSYELYRSTDNVLFSWIASLPPQQTDYSDYDVKVQENRYAYKVRIRNNCDVAEDLGDNTTTIVLQGEKTDDRVVHLKWNPYDKWVDGVDHYIIEKLDDFGNWKIIKQVNGTTTTADFHDE